MATPASATQTGFGPGASVRADRMIPVFASKMRKQPMPAQRQDVGAGEILHCDMKGPLDLAYNRASNAIVVVDESTRMVAAKEMQTDKRPSSRCSEVHHLLLCSPPWQENRCD